MKKFLFFITCMLVASISFAQPAPNTFMGGFNSGNNPSAQQFRGPARRGMNMNPIRFRGWGGMFNFEEHQFQPIFRLNTPYLNQVRVYISEIPAFEQRFSHKRNSVVTFEIPGDSTSTTLLRFYGVDETIEFLKEIKAIMVEISNDKKLSDKEIKAYTKRIKKVIPKSAYFWEDYAGFNNKIEPKFFGGSEPMIVLQGISYCRIKFKDLSSIIDPEFSGDESIWSEIQLPFNSIEEVTQMIEQLNFTANMPTRPTFGLRQRGFGLFGRR
jgi:hypothetical protein